MILLRADGRRVYNKLTDPGPASPSPMNDPYSPSGSPSGNNHMGARAERAAAGIVPNRNGAVTSAVLGAPTRGTGPLRLALAGATRSGSAGVGSPSSRSAGEATPHSSGVNCERQLILGWRLSPNRDIAAAALLIVSRLALTAALPVLPTHRRALSRGGAGPSSRCHAGNEARFRRARVACFESASGLIRPVIKKAPAWGYTLRPLGGFLCPGWGPQTRVNNTMHCQPLPRHPLG